MSAVVSDMKTKHWLVIVGILVGAQYVYAVIALVMMANTARLQGESVLRQEWRNEERALADDVLQAYLDGRVDVS